MIHPKTSLTRALLLAGCAAAFAAPAFAQTPEQPSTGPAAATAETAAAEDADAETIIVTGSRIARPNLEGASPVTVVSSEEIRLQGATRIEDVINSLPQAFAGQGGGISNGSTGTATVDLRNLGPERTLVLINGRRLMPGDPRDPVADLNTIPAALVESVEVLTGGASSVYGADAVAGVVNFNLKTDFVGVQIDAQYSVFQHNNDAGSKIRDPLNTRGFGFPDGNVVDGAQFDTNVTIGAETEDGRGNVVVYAGYRKIDSVLQRDRDYSAGNLTGSGANFVAGGSGTPFPARFLANGGGPRGFVPGETLPDGINPNTIMSTDDPDTPFDDRIGRPFQIGDAVPTLDAEGNLVLDEDGLTIDRFPAPTGTTIVDITRANIAGALRPYSGARDAYNFAPTNFYQRPDERFMLGGFAQYEVSSSFTPYLEVMFKDDRTVAQIAPSGSFGQQFNIRCDNPLLSAEQVAALCTAFGYSATDPNPNLQAAPTVIFRRNVEGGGRQDDLRHTSYRIVVGTKGDISENWKYDLYGQFGRTIFNQVYRNDFSIARLGRAFDVVQTPTGPACRSAVDLTDPACVPYNIFSLNSVTPEALAYLQTPGFSNGQTTEEIISGSVSGTLGDGFLFADEAIGVAIGAEYRRNSLDFDVDSAFSTGDLAGQGGATLGVSGDYDVKEIFGEVRIPIAQGQPFFEDLSVTGGYRYSDYSTSSGSSYSTDTYKAEFEWAPIRAIRLRGSYNRAVRSPNVVEFFTNQSNGLWSGADGCAVARPGTDTPAFTAAECDRTGVTAAQYGNILANSADQYNELAGGNPLLSPEKSDSYTGGIVLQPQGFLRGFTATVDYFNIKITGLVSTIGSQLILDTCAQTGDASLCNLIQRDPVNGSLWIGERGRILNTNLNVGSLKTSGVDVVAAYTVDAGSAGGFDLNFTGTYTDEYVLDPGVPNGDFTSYDCKGLFGVTCGTPIPEWRHRARVTYKAPSVFAASLAWRYTSSVRAEGTSDNPYITNGVVNAVDSKIKAYHWFDLTLTADVTEQATVRVGVNNMFDRDPPIIGSTTLSGTFGNGNTYPQVYDALGRYIFAGVTLKF